MSELAKVIHHGGGAIAELRLNRPEARNALSQPLLEAARAALAPLAACRDVRVILISGEGKAFCAGMDLKALLSDPPAMGKLLMLISLLLREIRRTPQPTIACVRGAAIGGGCGLMSVCDFAFSHPEARIGYPEVDLGVCPAVVAPWLVRKLGSGRARQILLAGGTMTGTRARELGLISHLAPEQALESECLSFAEGLAKGGREAMSATKTWLNELDGSMHDEILDKAASISARIVQGEEALARLGRLFGSTERP
jgi:methylglutaconyl-CoA hydratase